MEAQLDTSSVLQVGVVLTVLLLPVTLVERQLCTLFTKMVPRFERSQAHPQLC